MPSGTNRPREGLISLNTIVAERGRPDALLSRRAATPPRKEVEPYQVTARCTPARRREHHGHPAPPTGQTPCPQPGRRPPRCLVAGLPSSPSPHRRLEPWRGSSRQESRG